MLYTENNTFFLQGKKSRKRFLRKNNHLGNSSPSPHDAAFLLSRLPLFALSCNHIMIYVGSTSSFSQKFTSVFKEFGNFCCILSSYEASIDVDELLP